MTPTTSTPAPSRPSRRAGAWRRATVAGLAGVLLVAAPGVAAAASGGEEPAATRSADELRPRIERACLRIPNLQIRTDNLLARLQGDATTRGSLAWLQVQIDRARERGRDDLVLVLENRLAVRTATIPVLEQRAIGLDRLAERCAELGVEL